jgi:hypothetical protein
VSIGREGRKCYVNTSVTVLPFFPMAIIGTTLEAARTSLEACLVNQGLFSSLIFDVPETQMHPASEDVKVLRDCIKMEMYMSFELVEEVLCPSCNILDTDGVEVQQMWEREVCHAICCI